MGAEFDLDMSWADARTPGNNMLSRSKHTRYMPYCPKKSAYHLCTLAIAI